MSQEPSKKLSTGGSPSKILVGFVCFLSLLACGYQIYTYRDVWLPEAKPRIRIDPSEFDLDRLIIPPGELRSGGPTKDGIPSLNSPQMISVKEADYLLSDDRVIGVVFQNEAKAYPLKILNFHEIVNDQVGDRHVAITYCPLCDSVALFDRRDGDKVREFGVSGFLYNSNVLMFDRGAETESLWSQMMTQSVSGPTVETRLLTLPVELTTWSEWIGRYPNTTVLSIETGHKRNYDSNIYESYFNQADLFFMVKPRNHHLPTKERVLGVWTDGVARAYPVSVFNEDQPQVSDDIAGHKLTIKFNPKTKSQRVTQADPGLQWVYSFWFAWYAFHPETEIYSPDKQGS